MTTRWIPENSKEIKAGRVTAYTYKAHSRFIVVWYVGRQAKHTAHKSYATIEERAEYINKLCANAEKARASRTALKAATKKARKELATSLIVGDVVVASYGYNMTSVIFYQVVDVSATGKTVKVREIKSKFVCATSAKSSEIMPVLDAFKDDEILSRRPAGKLAVKIEGHLLASKWNRLPQTETRD